MGAANRQPSQPLVAPDGAAEEFTAAIEASTGQSLDLGLRDPLDGAAVADAMEQILLSPRPDRALEILIRAGVMEAVSEGFASVPNRAGLIIGILPNAVEDAHFTALRQHFSEEEIVDLVSVISLFGWLNRWNDTLATELEAGPLAFAGERLAPHGWEVDKHRAG